MIVHEIDAGFGDEVIFGSMTIPGSQILAVALAFAALLLSACQSDESDWVRQTRSQFIDWGMALEQFNLEYGSYPVMFEDRESINLAERGNAGFFIMSLAARDSSGGRLTEEMRLRYNPKQIPFYTFGDVEMYPVKQGQVQLVDAFENSNIVVHVDHDGDGYLTVPIDGKMMRVQAQICIYNNLPVPSEQVMEMRP